MQIEKQWDLWEPIGTQGEGPHIGPLQAPYYALENPYCSLDRYYTIDDMNRFITDPIVLHPFVYGAGTILDLFGTRMRYPKFGSYAQDSGALCGDLQSVGNDFSTVLSRSWPP